MEFLIILLMILAVLYFVIIAPMLRARQDTHSSDPSHSRSGTTRAATRHAARPQMSPLLGIEISASQRRRLGRNDPSVIAAKLYHQQKDQFASFQTARPQSHSPHNQQSVTSKLNTFFNNLMLDESTTSSRRQNQPTHSTRPVAPVYPTTTNPKPPPRRS